MPLRPDPRTIITRPSPNIPYFTPQQPAIAGAFRGKNKAPKVFTPVKIRDLQLVNRIGVSPMCIYSAEDGVATDYHLVHYGQYALRGPSFTIMESTGVVKEGRITPHCLGIYNEEQRKQLKKIVDLYHSQGKFIGPQLSHAGMKASTLPLYYEQFDYPVDEKRGGWLDNVWGSSLNKQFPYSKELSIPQIEQLVLKFKEASRAAISECGFDFIELHAAHGYLIHQFLSPLANKRTDKYGGSFENRVRFLLEIIQAVVELRKELKVNFPVLVRISASDNDESNPDSWRAVDSLKLAPLLVKYGVDLIDVSSGGLTEAKSPKVSQSELARRVKSVVKDTCLVSAVGGIFTGKRAEELLEDGDCDICLSGRGFLKDAGIVENWAEELGVDIQLNMQEGWPFGKVWTK
ncbi:DEKNAAC101496 [Brettanomyces naardenensis]|uniref:DEKNAAC101496 n=1 Tax=Brettanomyces naardenensis TaxID=13370 RepID=A0A448YI39_BRENA|nr:DEKNAAC101496 [Brettanomyces naardenensis]